MANDDTCMVTVIIKEWQTILHERALLPCRRSVPCLSDGDGDGDVQPFADVVLPYEVFTLGGLP